MHQQYSTAIQKQMMHWYTFRMPSWRYWKAFLQIYNDTSTPNCLAFGPGHHVTLLLFCSRKKRRKKLL